MAAIRDFALDDDGDIAVVNGDFAAVADEEAVVQGIAVRLRSFLAECWLDEAQGVDWIGKILIKGADPLLVRELLREAVADTPDVLEVASSFVEQQPDRSARVYYRVRTVYSTQPLSQEVPLP